MSNSENAATPVAKIKPNAVSVTKRVFSVLWWVAVVLLVIVLVSVIGAKLQGKVPSVFGFSVLQIISGSMEPEIPTGSYILVKKTDPTEVSRGDVISFYSDDPAILGMPNTHRVEDIDVGGDGITFITKGTANTGVDSVPARGDQLIGVHVCNLDWLTDFSGFLSGGGMMIFLVGLQIGIAVIVVLSMLKKGNTQEEEKK